MRAWQLLLSVRPPDGECWAGEVEYVVVDPLEGAARCAHIRKRLAAAWWGRCVAVDKLRISIAYTARMITGLVGPGQR